MLAKGNEINSAEFFIYLLYLFKNYIIQIKIRKGKNNDWKYKNIKKK